MAGHDNTPCRILSIQSHVVHGYVGNRSAVFPLQLLGFEVDYIDSVQFSNHTWYGVFKGPVLDADALESIYQGLKQNNLHHYDYILTGYIGSESFLFKVRDIIKELKEVNPNIKYVCDPVMGDDGVMYVPKELLPIYQDHILPLADIVLPNQWEAELLLNVKIDSEDSVKSALAAMHARGPGTVVLSSTSLAGQPDHLVGYASTKSADGDAQCVKMEVPKIDAMFIGTGDLFAALWLAWSHHNPGNLKVVAGKVQSTMQHVLKRTIDSAKQAAGSSKPSWEQLELKLIQSKRDIEDPAICVGITDC